MFGTPAEEGGGGKIDMLDAGSFKGIDIAMMSHPWNAPIFNCLARIKYAKNVIYQQ